PAPESSGFTHPSPCEGLCCLGPGRPVAGRGTQVVRERSAKPLCVGSIPTRASILSVASLQTAIESRSGADPSAPDARGSRALWASPRNFVVQASVASLQKKIYIGLFHMPSNARLRRVNG